MSELTAAETTQLSKLLSYILRHGAVKESLTISPDGYIAVKDLVKTRSIFFEMISNNFCFIS